MKTDKTGRGGNPIRELESGVTLQHDILRRKGKREETSVKEGDQRQGLKRTQGRGWSRGDSGSTLCRTIEKNKQKGEREIYRLWSENE